MEVKLSKEDVRKLALYGQFGFNGTGDDNFAGMIAHLGYVQIDSISVIQRAHHHVLWSRNHAYQRGTLTRLQHGQRKIFEYWSHAAAYLPIDHYRFCLPRMRRLQKTGFTWHKRDKKAIKYALDKITAEGPMQAKDFKGEENRNGTGWWDWKPMKVALEHLFHEGQIMVVKRNNFQKVYDLTQRVLPPGAQTRKPSDKQMASFLIDNTLRSLGVASEKDMAYQKKDGVKTIKTILAEKIENQEVTVVKIDGVDRTYYVHQRLLERMQSQPNDGFTGVRILSPFDNQVIIRQRLRELFDFDFQLECYLPKEKRIYGYFSLPILYNGGFVGLMDAKAFRREKTLCINHLYVPQFPRNSEEFCRYLLQEINAFRDFNQCTEIEIRKVSPGELETCLKR